MESIEFYLTQGLPLILIKPLEWITNCVLNHVIYITYPINNIGYRDSG